MPRRFLTPRARGAAKVAAVNAAVFLGLLTVVELTMGSWLYGPDLGALSINKNVYRTRDVSDLYPAPGPIVFRRDQYGLRGDYGSLEDIDILAVGGSTTNEANVGEGETWVDVLQARLRAAGHDASVANAGVDGHSTVAHVRALDEWFAELPGLAPAYVLFYIGINDALVPETGINPADTMTYAGPWRRARAYIGNHSAVVHGVKVARGWLIARQGGVTHGGASVPSQGDWEPAKVPSGLAEAYATRLRDYEGRLTALARGVRALGATPIFVTQAHGYARWRDGELYEISGSRAGRRYAILSLYNRVTLKFCRDRGEICIDLDGEITLQPTDFYDNIHVTPSGSRKIGEYLSKALVPILNQAD